MFGFGKKNPARFQLIDHIIGLRIATTFLGLNLGTEETPLYYETMVSSNYDLTIITNRYATQEEAIIGHNSIKAGIKKTVEMSVCEFLVKNERY